MFKEFKEFAVKGNVIDMAVGVIIGSAFGKIITSFVNDVIMPPFGLILGKMDFSNLFISLSGKSFQSLAEAKAAGAPTLNIGLFLNTIIDFLIVASVIFLLIKQVNRFKKKPVEEVLTKECPYCCSSIPVNAKKCLYCTSDLS